MYFLLTRRGLQKDCNKQANSQYGELNVEFLLNLARRKSYFSSSFSVRHLQWVSQGWPYLKKLIWITTCFRFLKKRSSGTTYNMGFYVKEKLLLLKLTLKYLECCGLPFIKNVVEARCWGYLHKCMCEERSRKLNSYLWSVGKIDGTEKHTNMWDNFIYIFEFYYIKMSECILFSAFCDWAY